MGSSIFFNNLTASLEFEMRWYVKLLEIGIKEERSSWVRVSDPCASRYGKNGKKLTTIASDCLSINVPGRDAHPYRNDGSRRSHLLFKAWGNGWDNWIITILKKYISFSLYISKVKEPLHHSTRTIELLFAEVMLAATVENAATYNSSVVIAHNGKDYVTFAIGRIVIGRRETIPTFGKI